MALDHATARRAIDALLRGLLGEPPDLTAHDVGRHMVEDLRHTTGPLQPEIGVHRDGDRANLVVHVPDTGQMFDVAITERKSH